MIDEFISSTGMRMRVFVTERTGEEEIKRRREIERLVISLYNKYEKKNNRADTVYGISD